jgi:hypothetical protein
MNKFNKLFISIVCVLAPVGVEAQNDYDSFKQRMENEFSNFRDTHEKEFEAFRKKVNDEYSEFLKKAWNSYDKEKPIPKPKDNNIPPKVYPKKDEGNKPINNPIPIDIVVTPVKPQPQPTPIVPIEEKPEPVVNYLSFGFFGTTLKVRFDDNQRFRLGNCDKTNIANVWKRLSSDNYNNLINDCLNIRSTNKLCDWAYLLMLKNLTEKIFNGKSNESTLLMAYIYCQSGYKMRLAANGSNLVMLYSSAHMIYDKPYWTIDNERYYVFDSKVSQLNICNAAYPEEKSLSLYIPTEQLLANNTSQTRDLCSKRYPYVKAEVCTNKNLINFYNTYPTSSINNDFGTRWAMYANTPLSLDAKRTLYPSLLQAIDNKPQLEAVNRILNFVQTALVYEYDDKVWGYDRAFFPDETLYYPYCDCEDRAILFSRIIRDLLHLDVVLIYYPGHLASAVKFTANVTGDYIMVNNEKYVICDPTYINAPVGETMSGMDNTKAKVIVLND